jgi:hypothetical protein
MLRVRAPSRHLQRARVVADAPVNHGQNITVIGAVTTQSVLGTLMFPGSTDGPAFLAFVQHVLVPKLRPPNRDLGQPRCPSHGLRENHGGSGWRHRLPAPPVLAGLLAHRDGVVEDQDVGAVRRRSNARSTRRCGGGRARESDELRSGRVVSALRFLSQTVWGHALTTVHCVSCSACARHASVDAQLPSARRQALGHPPPRAVKSARLRAALPTSARASASARRQVGALACGAADKRSGIRPSLGNPSSTVMVQSALTAMDPLDFHGQNRAS